MIPKVFESIGRYYKRLCELARKISAASRPTDLPLVLALDQLQRDRPKTLRRLASILGKLDANELADVAGSLWLANAPICEELSEYLRTQNQYEAIYKVLRHSVANSAESAAYTISELGGRESLWRVMRATDNPFTQETAALQLLGSLASGLLEGKLSSVDLHPYGVALSMRNWDKLKDPSNNSSLQVSKEQSVTSDPRFALPQWATGDKADLYALGRLVRSAVLGTIDFTSSSAQLHQSLEGYRGLRSSWYKRQHGLSGKLELTEWEHCSCSPWLDSLLMHLLRWPGCRFDSEGEFAEVTTTTKLLEKVRQRIRHLDKLYGKSSSLPIYDVQIRNSLKNPPVISIGLIQTVRPTHEDLQIYGPELNGHGFRAIQRAHLASLLRLAWEHAKLRKTYDKNPQLDVVVLPEIAVHRQDVDLVERFIDATQAIVFCGLSFYKHERLNKLVNSGLWILPERRNTGRSFRYLLQGKEHMMKSEVKLKIRSHRPHQYILRMDIGDGRKPVAISGAICFDATDLKLASDLRDLTDMLIIPANNKDVPTFDTMATALSWHMFQHVVIVNSGEFGGTVVQAPYKERHERTLVHDHGGMQAAISIVEIDLSDYQRMREKPPHELKSPPAGFDRH